MKKNLLHPALLLSKKAACLALAGALALSLVLAGCGAGSKSASDKNAATLSTQSWSSAPATGGYEEMTEEAVENTTAQEDAIVAEAGALSKTLDPNQALQNKNVKLIWYADVTMETLDFNALVAKVEETVSQYQGYVESSSVSGGDRLSGRRDSHYADYTIRIPSGQLNSFLNQMGSLGNITYQNLRSENITLEYADNEARKMTLELEEQKLMELLEQAATLEDIIQLESRLSEIHYQLDALSSTLRKYDDLVDYSTVYLSVHEVEKMTETPQTMGQRISSGFSDSLYQLQNMGEDLVVFLIARSPILLLVAAAAFLFLVLMKKLNQHNKKKIARYEEQRQAALKQREESLKQDERK